MRDNYSGREQTGVKHFILEHYLQALVFKVLHFSDVTYVDGFSGPWKARAADFADTSFMIALRALKNAQAKLLGKDGRPRQIRCFFSETAPSAFGHLKNAVAPFNKPEERFEVQTFCGPFEDAIPEINTYAGGSFKLIFIDPTGWTGYPFEKIKPIFEGKCEVLINFMYEFVNRAASMSDTKTINSLAPILGGSDWPERLDPSLPPGPGVEKLFRRTLQDAGSFGFVVSTKVDRATRNRPHFFIAFGTKKREGLIEFRNIEYKALRTYAPDRAWAKERRREARTGSANLFADHDAELEVAAIDRMVEDQIEKAKVDLLQSLLSEGPMPFAVVVNKLLQAYMVRETDVKDICVSLAKAGKVRKTWGGGKRKPGDEDLIGLPASPRT